MNMHISGWQRWVGGAVLLFLIVMGLTYWFLSFQSRFTHFTSREASIELKYSARLVPGTMSEQDKKDKVVLRLKQPQKEPELLVTLRYETGLKPIATTSKQDLRDALADTLDKTYPKRFPQYQRISSRNFDVDAHRASELIFTYKSPAGETVKQRFILIVINDDKAAYLSQQSKENDFEQLNRRYFDTITKSLQVN